MLVVIELDFNHPFFGLILFISGSDVLGRSSEKADTRPFYSFYTCYTYYRILSWHSCFLDLPSILSLKISTRIHDNLSDEEFKMTVSIMLHLFLSLLFISLLFVIPFSLLVSPLSPRLHSNFSHLCFSCVFAFFCYCILSIGVHVLIWHDGRLRK